MAEQESDERRYNGDEAKGAVRLRRGRYGPLLEVNDRLIATIDLFPPTEGDPPQILFHDEADDEPLVKVVLTAAGLVVVVNGRTHEYRLCNELCDKLGVGLIHSDGTDQVFAWPGLAARCPQGE